MNNPDARFYFIVPFDIIRGSMTDDQIIEIINKNLEECFMYVSGDGCRIESDSSWYFAKDGHKPRNWQDVSD